MKTIAPSGTSSTGSWFTRLANPTRFMQLSGRILPWLSGVTILLLGVGLVAALNASADYQQGIMVRILYIHVPFAWLSMLCYTVMTASALGTLVWRHPLADISAKAAAPIGAVFTLLALLTGAIWGKPTWGTYWVWDARLTSVLVLLIMYLGIMALYAAIDDASRAARFTAVVILAGFINIPIIKFSVDWWNTLHQPASVFRLDGPTIDPSLLWQLALTASGFTCLFVTLHLVAMRSEVMVRRIGSMRRAAVAKMEAAGE